MFDEDILADVKINLVNVPVNIDRQIVSGMRMPLVASATKGTLQGILVQSMVSGLTRGRARPVMGRGRSIKVERYTPSRFRTSSDAHTQLIRQTDREWRQIVQNSENPQQLQRETNLFYNRLRSRIGNYQIDRVKRGEISLEQAIPRPTGGRLEPTSALQRRQSALEGIAPVSTRRIAPATTQLEARDTTTATRIIEPVRDTTTATRIIEPVRDTTTRRISPVRDTTTRRIPATVTGDFNFRTTRFTQRQTEAFSRNEWGAPPTDLIRRGVLDINDPIIESQGQRESHRIGLDRQRQMFSRKRREAWEADIIRYREGK